MSPFKKVQHRANPQPLLSVLKHNSIVAIIINPVAFGGSNAARHIINLRSLIWTDGLNYFTKYYFECSPGIFIPARF